MEGFWNAILPPLSVSEFASASEFCMDEKAVAMEQLPEISMRLTLPLSAVVTDSVLKNSAQEVDDCYKTSPPPPKNHKLAV